jgi:hypothetical protein
VERGESPLDFGASLYRAALPCRRTLLTQSPAAGHTFATDAAPGEPPGPCAPPLALASPFDAPLVPRLEVQPLATHSWLRRLLRRIR